LWHNPDLASAASEVRLLARIGHRLADRSDTTMTQSRSRGAWINAAATQPAY